MADVVITIENHNGVRTVKAEKRIPELPEYILEWDEATGCISNGGLFHLPLDERVINFVKKNPGGNKTQIKSGVRGGNDAIAAEVNDLTEKGILQETEEGIFYVSEGTRLKRVLNK